MIEAETTQEKILAAILAKSEITQKGLAYKQLDEVFYNPINGMETPNL